MPRACSCLSLLDCTLLSLGPLTVDTTGRPSLKPCPLEVARARKSAGHPPRALRQDVTPGGSFCRPRQLSATSTHPLPSPLLRPPESFAKRRLIRPDTPDSGPEDLVAGQNMGTGKGKGKSARKRKSSTTSSGSGEYVRQVVPWPHRSGHNLD